jgi:inorganic triphosphatase YgiF
VTEPIETELKLSVATPRRLARRIRNLELEPFGDFLPAGEARHVVILDRLFDTAVAGGRLQQQAMRARLRRRGSRVTLTVKRSGALRTDGISSRVELEAPGTWSLDPRRWPASDAKAALLTAIGDEPIVEIGRLRQDRLVRVVRGHGAEIELSLDRVDAIADGRVARRRYELEVELKHGGEPALASLGEILSHVSGLGPAAGSKLLFALEAVRESRNAPNPLVDSRPR